MHRIEYKLRFKQEETTGHKQELRDLVVLGNGGEPQAADLPSQTHAHASIWV